MTGQRQRDLTQLSSGKLALLTMVKTFHALSVSMTSGGRSYRDDRNPVRASREEMKRYWEEVGRRLGS